MKKILLLWISLLTICSVANSQNPKRAIKQIVISEQLPNIQIEVNPALTYIGNVSFKVDTFAHAEEYIFSEIRNGKMGRTLIIHFEHFLPSNNLKFIYPRFRMKKIGNHEYLHQIFYVKNFSLFQTKELVDLFKDKALVYESDWIMNRYVRAVDKSMKHELIFFYLEPGNPFSDQIRDEAEKINPGEITMTQWQENLSKRALNSFKVSKE